MNVETARAVFWTFVSVFVTALAILYGAGTLGGL